MKIENHFLQQCQHPPSRVIFTQTYVIVKISKRYLKWFSVFLARDSGALKVTFFFLFSFFHLFPKFIQFSIFLMYRALKLNLPIFSRVLELQKFNFTQFFSFFFFFHPFQMLLLFSIYLLFSVNVCNFIQSDYVSRLKTITQ